MFRREEEKKGKLIKNMALVGGTAVLVGFFVKRLRNRDKDLEELDYTGEDSYHEIDLSKKTRRYFLVYQNNNYKEEKEQGFIWAPQETESGRNIFHWDNLRRVRKGDVVFSLVDREIVSVNKARDNCFEYQHDGVKGYRVDLEYNQLDSPIDVDDYMEEILELSPDKYAPFNIMGRSNSGYLFDIGDRLGEYMESIVETEG